jgi:TPR repeat protein
MNDTRMVAIGRSMIQGLCMTLILLLTGPGCVTSGVGNNVRTKAEAGDSAAQCAMGNYYIDRHIAPTDASEAAKWYRLAAEQGHAEAQANLGMMYAMGEGIPQDMVQGYMWLKLAGKRGYSRGLMGASMLERKMEIWDVNKGDQLAAEWKPKGGVTK